MKEYYLQNNIISEATDKSNVKFINLDNTRELEDIDLFNKQLLNEIKTTRGAVTLDFHKEYYYGNLLLEKEFITQTTNVFFVADDNNIYFLHYNNLRINELISILNNDLDKYVTIYNKPIFLILLLFNQLIKFEATRTKRLQSEIDKIENSLISDKEMSSYNLKILEIRKRLTKIRKNINNINDVIDTLQSELDSFLELVQYVDLIDNRAQRLTHDIQNMIERTIQIKEVYQNQLDINLNNTMYIFTVISAIFLPLNLIVGWFGMNFVNMPELNWKYGYLMVIILSVSMVFFIIYLMKRFDFIKSRKK